MGSPSAGSRFSSEAAWPFTLRLSQLASCRQFLAASAPTPRVLRVVGGSGTGKSFLVRELLVEAANDDDMSLGLYLDVPPSDLEASGLFGKLDLLLSQRRDSSRDAPSFVSRKAARAWLSTKRGTSAKRTAYAQRALRDLVGQIPLIGPFIRALLPQLRPVAGPAADFSAPIRFVMKWSRSRPVLLAIDNVQFLPFAVREMLAAALSEAGPGLRLVLVERTLGRSRSDWAPEVPRAELMDVELGNASLEEVTDLVRDVLPDAEDFQDVASTIFRRSDGNLKSVWFQLRLIAARREEQEVLAASYEDVILTLPPLDQAVLRFIVFTVGGLTIANLVSLLQATDLHLRPDAITSAIADLAALGLLVVNGENASRVRVEHELVAQVVNEVTPEEEKLDVRDEAVAALSSVLDAAISPVDEPMLYDRLLGMVTDVELRHSPSLLAHVVNFIQIQSELERHAYLASVCRDSVCWDVLDALPETSLRSLLDAIQKSSLFSFGLVAAARLRRSGAAYESLASLYEAKYLVQLFRYDDAKLALERVHDSKEKRAVSFNILLNLAGDDRAAEIAMEVYSEVSEETGTEQDYLILRNSGHLFAPDDARVLVQASLDGFENLGRRFGVATALNNLGIVDLASGSLRAAGEKFVAARRLLAELDSLEVYQPLVNLSAISLLQGDIPTAAQLLDSASDMAPGSLVQDRAMLDLNAVTLEICLSKRIGGGTITRMQTVAAAARKTRDLRFLDIAAWFAEHLQGTRSQAVTSSGRWRRVEEIRTSGRVPLEVFVSVCVEGTQLDVPFVLSPHWRY